MRIIALLCVLGSLWSVDWGADELPDCIGGRTWGVYDNGDQDTNDHVYRGYFYYDTRVYAIIQYEDEGLTYSVPVAGAPDVSVSASVIGAFWAATVTPGQGITECDFWRGGDGFEFLLPHSDWRSINETHCVNMGQPVGVSTGYRNRIGTVDRDAYKTSVCSDLAGLDFTGLDEQGIRDLINNPLGPDDPPPGPNPEDPPPPDADDCIPIAIIPGPVSNPYIFGYINTLNLPGDLHFQALNYIGDYDGWVMSKSNVLTNDGWTVENITLVKVKETGVIQFPYNNSEYAYDVEEHYFCAIYPQGLQGSYEHVGSNTSTFGYWLYENDTYMYPIQQPAPGPDDNSGDDDDNTPDGATPNPLDNTVQVDQLAALNLINENLTSLALYQAEYNEEELAVLRDVVDRLDSIHDDHEILRERNQRGFNQVAYAVNSLSGGATLGDLLAQLQAIRQEIEIGNGEDAGTTPNGGDNPNWTDGAPEDFDVGDLYLDENKALIDAYTPDLPTGWGETNNLTPVTWTLDLQAFALGVQEIKVIDPTTDGYTSLQTLAIFIKALASVLVIWKFFLLNIKLYAQ